MADTEIATDLLLCSKQVFQCYHLCRKYVCMNLYGKLDENGSNLGMLRVVKKDIARSWHDFVTTLYHSFFTEPIAPLRAAMPWCRQKVYRDAAFKLHQKTSTNQL